MRLTQLRIFQLLFLLLCVMVISACSSKDTASPSQASPSQAAETPQETAASAEPAMTNSPEPTSSSTPSPSPVTTDKPTKDSGHMHEDAHAAGSSAPSGKSGGKNTESTPTAKETTKPAVQATSTPKATPTNTPVAESVGKVHVVEIKNFAFSPSKLEIKAGDSVKFINKDEVRHTATADDDSFDTGLFGQDEEKVVVFSEEGEFAYYCAPHPAMLGTITVSAK